MEKRPSKNESCRLEEASVHLRVILPVHCSTCHISNGADKSEKIGTGKVRIDSTASTGAAITSVARTFHVRIE